MTDSLIVDGVSQQSAVSSLESAPTDRLTHSLTDSITAQLIRQLTRSIAQLTKLAAGISGVWGDQPTIWQEGE